jgi:NAD(P)-dependent dehydrogenase (short-subunit alcohol dehydrogenase family)
MASFYTASLASSSPIWSTILSALPGSISTHLQISVSIFYQFLNLVIGRLLPDLTRHITNTDLTGKNIIVTGSNSGIGLQIATELTKRGANVVLACRSLGRGETARKDILMQCPCAKGRVQVLKLDTSNLQSVKDFAPSWKKFRDSQSDDGTGLQLDVLVHNAGISHAPAGKDFTDDGLEMLYATNFLGSFLLTRLLEQHLRSTARVVLTSSTGQLAGRFRKDFASEQVKNTIEPGFHVSLQGQSESGSAKYAMTKAMQCAFARSLQCRFDRQDSQRTAHAFSPDFTFTPIFSKFGDSTGSWIKSFLADPLFVLLKISTWLATSVAQGAATGAWLACTTESRVAEGGGGYWDRMNRAFSVADSMTDDMLQRLWRRWESDCEMKWS